MGDRWSVVPPPPRTSVGIWGRRHMGASAFGGVGMWGIGMWARRHVGAAALRAARAARAWLAVVRAVEVAAVTASASQMGSASCRGSLPRCGSLRHASNGPIGTILRPVTSVGGRTRYRRIRKGFLEGESRVSVTLVSLNTLLTEPGAQWSRSLRGRPQAGSYRPVVLQRRSPIAIIVA